MADPGEGEAGTDETAAVGIGAIISVVIGAIVGGILYALDPLLIMAFFIHLYGIEIPLSYYMTLEITGFAWIVAAAFIIGGAIESEILKRRRHGKNPSAESE
jgi:hypothetical protein